MTLRDGNRVLVAAHDLTAAARADVVSLAALCNQSEGLDLPAEMDPADTPPSGSTNQFLYYRDGSLVGFVSLQQGPAERAGGDEFLAIEICGMVHPAHRRQSIGRMLLAAAQVECRRRDVSSCLITCDAASPSGIAFATAVGAQYEYSEYRMKLEPERLLRRSPAPHVLELRRVTVDHLDSIARVAAAAFGDDEDAMREWISAEIRESSQQHYLAALGIEPVGTLRASQRDGDIFITAFGVLPSYQGRGFGGEILGRIIDLLIDEGQRSVMIEVATENRKALDLYRRCGFRETTTYDYYRCPA